MTASGAETAHGCFKKYLHRFGLADTPLCPNNEETPEYLVFDCLRFRTACSEMLVDSAENLSLANIVKNMSQDVDTWDAVPRGVT